MLLLSSRSFAQFHTRRPGSSEKDYTKLSWEVEVPLIEYCPDAFEQSDDR